MINAPVRISEIMYGVCMSVASIYYLIINIIIIIIILIIIVIVIIPPTLLIFATQSLYMYVQ